MKCSIRKSLFEDFNMVGCLGFGLYFLGILNLKASKMAIIWPKIFSLDFSFSVFGIITSPTRFHCFCSATRRGTSYDFILILISVCVFSVFFYYYFFPGQWKKIEQNPPFYFFPLTNAFHLFLLFLAFSC